MTWNKTSTRSTCARKGNFVLFERIERETRLQALRRRRAKKIDRQRPRIPVPIPTRSHFPPRAAKPIKAVVGGRQGRSQGRRLASSIAWLPPPPPRARGRRPPGSAAARRTPSSPPPRPPSSCHARAARRLRLWGRRRPRRSPPPRPA